MQQRLAQLGYQLTVNSRFDRATADAVAEFQRANSLYVDGVIGEDTLNRLFSPKARGPLNDAPATAAPGVGAAEAPAASALTLINYDDELLGSLRRNQLLLCHDPDTGLQFSLTVYSVLAKHVSAEPATRQDAQIMLRVFGGKQTLKEQAFCVQLPDGRWTLCAASSMPRDRSSVNNGFNGRVDVYFMRRVDDVRQDDHKAALRHQDVIRALWRELRGSGMPW